MVMTQLPQRLTLLQMQQQWATIINPVITNPALNVSILPSIALKTGKNVVNHLLGRSLQGWYVTRLRGSAPAIYDLQDANQTPQLTLVLESSGNIVIDLAVF